MLQPARSQPTLDCPSDNRQFCSQRFCWEHQGCGPRLGYHRCDAVPFLSSFSPLLTALFELKSVQQPSNSWRMTILASMQDSKRLPAGHRRSRRLDPTHWRFGHDASPKIILQCTTHIEVRPFFRHSACQGIYLKYSAILSTNMKQMKAVNLDPRDKVSALF